MNLKEVTKQLETLENMKLELINDILALPNLYDISVLGYNMIKRIYNDGEVDQYYGSHGNTFDNLNELSSENLLIILRELLERN